MAWRKAARARAAFRRLILGAGGCRVRRRPLLGSVARVPAPSSLTERALLALLRTVLRLPRPVKRALAGSPTRMDGQTLDLDVQVLLRLAALGHQPPKSSMTPQLAREQMRRSTAVLAGTPPRLEVVEDLELPGSIAARLYRPHRSEPGEARPVLVYFHGGGWVLGGLDYCDASARGLSNLARCMVVSVSYRLAPEHRFPAAYDDALAATKWVLANARELGADPDRAAIGGESAGATLATATCLALAREGHALLRMQLLVYPVTDLVGQDYPSYSDSAEARPLGMERLMWFVGHALPDSDQLEDFRVSPLRAPLEELAGLPPALVITAASDPLRDQGEAYALKLMDAGVQTSLTRFPGVMHGFFLMGAVLDTAQLAVTQAGTALRAAFE